MTCIKMERAGNGDPCYSLEVFGHADFAPVGQDIVCAGISTVIQALAAVVQQYAAEENGALEYGAVGYRNGMIYRIDAAPAEGYTPVVVGWFEMTRNALQMLERCYPRFVQVEVTGKSDECEGSCENCDIAQEAQHLQMYAEDGGAAEPGAETVPEAAADSAEAAPAPDAAETPTPAVPQLRPAQERLLRRSGLLKPEKPETATVYGKQEEVPAPDEAEAAPPDEGAEKQQRFDALMQGEYRDQFQSVVDEVVRQVMQAEHRPGMDGLLAALSRRYGVDAADLDGLTAAVSAPQKDDAYFEKLAKEHGVSVQQAKRMDELETENARLKAEQEAQQRRANERQVARAVHAIRADWERQAEALKNRYPAFDFASARQEPAFADLMQRGVGLEAAYRATHFDELLRAETAATAQAVERGVTERIANRGARPNENGTRPSGAMTVKTDVRSLTRADCEEIERRVMRGEKIHF